MRFAHAPIGVLLVGLLATRSANAADDELALDLAASTTLVIRKIPKGSFVEGSPSNEPLRDADEAARKVTISKPFWLGRTVVTRSQFALFVSETRHITDAEKGLIGGFGIDGKSGSLVQRKDFSWRNPGFPQRDDDPVVLVTFGDANAFVAWASRKTNRRVRLPTEAEWEYAARAGTTSPWFAASTEQEASQIGWFRLSAGGSTHPVATRKPNAFGLFDMAGNVQEWCRDVYAPYPPGEATDPETTSAEGTERRVLRGGSWLKDPKRGRSAARNKGLPGSKSAENGFRVAVDDEPTSTASGASSPGSAPVPPPPVAGADAGPSFVVPPSSRSEGGTPWSILLAPFVAAALSAGWVLARRGARRATPIPRTTKTTVRMPNAPQTPVPTSVPRVSEPPPSRLSMPPRVSILPHAPHAPTDASAASPAPLPSSTRRISAAPPSASMPASPASSAPSVLSSVSSAPSVPSPPVSSAPSVPSPPVSSAPSSIPIALASEESIPLSLPSVPIPISSSSLTGPPSSPSPSPSPSLSMTGPPSSLSPSMTGPPPPPPPSELSPPPAPFPLAQSMLPPASAPGDLAPMPPLPPPSFTGPPSPPSSRMTGPPSAPAPPPRDSVPSAPLATLLAALSSRPLPPPSVAELPEPPAPVNVPDPDVTAPYPALSSSVLVDDPEVTAPFKAIPKESDEGPPSPPRESS